jgi:hypothetical protein
MVFEVRDAQERRLRLIADETAEDAASISHGSEKRVAAIRLLMGSTPEMLLQIFH